MDITKEISTHTTLKETSETAKKIRRVEDFLREQGIEITYRPEGIIYRVDIEGKSSSFVILDDQRVVEQTTPSFAEPTRIQPIDNYIKGT